MKSLAKSCLHLCLLERTHGFFLGSRPLPSPAKERCASQQGITPSAEGRGVGEKDALRRAGCIRTTHPQTTPKYFPQKAPPAISKPTCHKHLRWLFSCLAINAFFIKPGSSFLSRYHEDILFPLKLQKDFLHPRYLSLVSCTQDRGMPWPGCRSLAGAHAWCWPWRLLHPEAISTGETAAWQQCLLVALHHK